jgi:hypothetical protein
MSLSSSGNQGYLDVTNAILRVGTLDVYGITGVDMVTNVVKQNAVLVWDDQGADMSTPPFQLGAGVTRTTSPPEIDLRNASGDNFMYHGLKLPNQWMAQFDLYLDTGTTGNVHLQMYTSSTTTYDDDGYQFIFDAANSTLTLEYDGTQVQQSAVTYTTGWQTFVVTFNRGAWGVARESDVVFSLDDDERSAVYDNTSGQYLRFETDATTSRKVRYLKFTNSGPWLQSKTGDISFLTGNVSVGHHSTAHKLSVAGSANVGALTATSVNVAGGVDATSTSTGDLTLTGLGVESNIHTSNLYASSNVGIGTTTPSRSLHVDGTALISDYYNGELQVEGRGLNYSSWIDITATQRSQSLGQTEGWWRIQSYGTVSQNGLFSIQKRSIDGTSLVSEPFNINKYSNVGIGTTNPLYKLDVHGTANVGAVTLNSNVYAPNLPLAEIASNLVTWDSATGDLMDSGGLISNKLAIVSEQPPAALTGDSTVVDGHGRYKVTRSSVFNAYEGYNIFSKIETDNWLSATDTYNSDGTYAASDSLGGISGEWVKLEMPYKTTLRHFTLRQDIDNTNIGQRRQFPVDFKVIASNDDTNWTTINTTTGVSTPAANDPALTVVVNANTSYKYYAIVVEKISAEANSNRCQIGEWRLFTETFTVDAGVVSTTAASGLETGFTEHPVAPMTDYKTYVEGHGTYEASASSYDSTYSLYPWRAFDNNPSLRWTISTDDDNYNVSTGEWDQTAIDASPHVFTSDVGGTRYHGHWLQIKLPYAITLSHSNVHPTNTILDRPPKDGVILGSNDGDNWYKLTQFTGKTYTSATWTRIDVNATTPYQYFRMCATKNGGDSKLELTEWRLFAEKPVTRMENVHISGELASETLQTGYIKWPKVPLKANDSEGYVASASSVYNSDVSTAPYTAFNNYREVKSNGYADAFLGGNGNFTSGVANTSRTTGTDTFNHEWLQIQMPRAITLSYFTLLQRVKNVDNDNDMPKNGRMYGSNDGISWTKLVTFSDLTYERFEETRVQVNSTTPYSYYRLAVTETVGDAAVYVAVGELQLFEAATGVGAAPTSAKLQVAGSLGMAKGAEFFAGDDVVMEFPAPTRVLKYPRVNMTGLTTGIYTASASENITSITNADKAFDGNPTVFWHSLGSFVTNQTYSGSTSITDIEGIEHFGVWLKIDLGEAIKLQYFTMYPRITFERRGPYDGQLLGSNDGTNWYRLTSFQGLRYENYKGTRVDVNSGSYFKQYALIIQKTGDTNCQVSEWELYGIPQSDPEATGVDIIHRSIINKPNQDFLEVYWDANDSNSYSFADSDAVYDLSGNGVTGTITGTNGFDAEYNAWVFDGSGDYVSGTLSNPAGDWVHSVSCWVSATELSSTKARFISYYGVEALRQQVILYVSSGQISVDFNSDRIYKDVSPFALNTWYHIAFTYSGGGTSNVKIYINGVDVGASGGGTTALNIASGQTLYVGKELNLTYNDPWKGSIANFRLFGGKVLNADQVRELYEYDAPRFGHRQNVVALHKGNLGVGVAHPTSRFEVAGADGLQEYPPRGITQPGSSYVGYRLEEYIEGHGQYVIDGTATYNTGVDDRRTWSLFDKGTETYHGSYYFTTGTPAAIDEATTTTNNSANLNFNTKLNSGATIFADWAQIELPHKILLKRNIVRNHNILSRSAAKGYIVASNDGITFDVLNTIDDFGYTTTYQDKVFETTTNTYYRIFRILFTHKVGGDDNFSFNMNEWRLFGTPAPSSLEDGHLTLGKALTLPRVSGHAAGAETPRAESLVLHYDTTVDSVVSGTTVVDISGQGANGTLIGDATYSSTDRALVFDGTGDYVSGTLNNPAGAWVHSSSFWVKLTGTSVDNETIFSIGTDAADKTSTFKFDTSTTLNWFFSGNDTKFNPQAQLNTWEHYVCVYDGGNVASSRRVWKNGVELSINVAANIDYLNLDSYASFRVANRSNLSQPAQCSISNFKIWNVALTAEEVAAEYALGRTGKSINLTDTALCLGGTVPRAQLDVRGGAQFDGRMIIGKTDNFLADDLDDITPTLDVRGLDDSYIRAHCVAGRSAGLILSEGTNNQFIMEYEGAGAGAGNYVTFYSGETGWPNGAKGLGLNYVPQSGKVGIGVTNPTSPLTIQHKDNTTRTSGMRFNDYDSSDYWSTWINNFNHLYFAFNGTDKGYILSDETGQMNFTGQHRTFIKDIPFTRAEELEGLIVSADNNKYIKMSGGIEVGSNAITTNESLPVVSLSTKANDKKCFGVISASEDPEERSDAYGSFVTPYEKELGDTRVYINSVGEGAMWVVNTNGPLESGDYITTSNVAGYGQRQDDDVLHNYTVAKITMDCDFNPPDIPVQRILKELANVTYWYQLEDATSNAYDRTQEETYWAVNRYTEVPGRVDEQSNVFVSPDHDLELYTKTRVNVITAEVWEALPEGERAYYSETDANTFAYTQTIQISPETWDDLSPEEQNTYVHGYYDLVVDEVPPETSGATQRTRTVYKNVVNETTEEPENSEDYLTEVRQEWVNVLDEHGQLQWEDVPWGATEKAYNIRYLDANGGLTTRHNAVHTAAFVGVTYHCG